MSIMRLHLSASVDFVNIYRSRHHTLGLSVIVTEMVSTMVFFLQRNYTCRTKISINFLNVRICPCMFHNYDFSVLWSMLVNPANNTSLNSRMKYYENVWNLSKINSRETRAMSMFLYAFMSMRSFQGLFLLTLN